VLLNGETGTGKEVFAQAIHNGSKRSGNTFVAINCSAFGKDLLESEMFGHKIGAFTGAVQDKKGLFEVADGGTIFLDELGEMDLHLQAKLLRVLESGTFIKVGDTKECKVDVRIITATNRDLEAESEAGNFRLDLYYRLSVFKITLPALSDRPEDIPILASYFLTLTLNNMELEPLEMGDAFLSALQKHKWKGNVRELRNVVERAVILCEGSVLQKDCLPFDFGLEDNISPEDRFKLRSLEQSHIVKVLQHTGGNKTKTAELLGIGLTTLYRKMVDYGIEK
jgi:two-component system NtrC family response regulator